MVRVQFQTPEQAARNDNLFRVLLAATNLSAQCNRATAATVAASSPADAGQAVLPRRAPWGPRSIPKSYDRSEEHTSELQSLMRISYAVFCLTKQNIHYTHL